MIRKDKETITRTDFELFFREHHSRLYFFALNITRDEETAKDIVSDMFAAAWNNRENIDKTKLGSYLYTGVRNRCLNEVKRAKRCEDIEGTKLPNIAADDSEAWRQRESRIDAIEGEIRKMPQRTRFILEECYYNHHTYKEVAEELGITTEGIKKQLSRAMAQLRSHFNKK
ncbi:MAG: RNA polymerase sigma factor [Prevotella sp.]